MLQINVEALISLQILLTSNTLKDIVTIKPTDQDRRKKEEIQSANAQWIRTKSFKIEQKTNKETE